MPKSAHCYVLETDIIVLVLLSIYRAPRLILFVMLNIWVSCCARLNVLLLIYTT